jgi:hypothetical protein
MKRNFLAVAMLALALAALQKAEARVDVSVDFFYDNLGDGGNWVEVGEYGYCWQPTVAVSNASWRPYSDGYWAYTDFGWTWISYEDFGWATYHYGRWMRLRGRGWVWVPGREWGPAWVSWRTGGDYVGWAESPITARVDIDFDIGPAYYNFIDIRYIGEPVLRERIFAPEQNVTYITKTVNVTNITYNNSAVYNYGPDYNTVSRYSTRPIQRLSLQRDTNLDAATPAQSRALMKVQGDKLVVASPQQLQKPTKPVEPKIVKEKIAQAPVERGWEPIADPKAQAELKEKIKQEDPKSIPPPAVQASDKTPTRPAASANTPAIATIGATAAPSAPAATAVVSPPKDKNRRPGKTAAPPNDSNRDKGKNKQRETALPNSTIPPAGDNAAPSVAPKSPKEKPDKRNGPPPPPPAPMPEAARIAPPPVPDKRQEKAPEANNPPASVEKPKHDRPPGALPKKNEPAISPTP